MYIVECTIYIVHFHCTLYNVHCTFFKEFKVQCSVHCTLYSDKLYPKICNKYFFCKPIDSCIFQLKIVKSLKIVLKILHFSDEKCQKSRTFSAENCRKSLAFQRTKWVP